MSGAAETGSVVIERVFPHAPAKVWRALTDGDLMARWLMPNDFRPEVGHRFTFRGQPAGRWDGIVDCEVLEIEPLKRLVIRWSVGAGAPGQLVTTIVYTLASEGDGARLRLVQSGFTPEQENNRRGAEFGLARMLDNLAALLPEIAP
jgi:uncharacterized protein YndB with AHSA1/START domain